MDGEERHRSIFKGPDIADIKENHEIRYCREPRDQILHILRRTMRPDSADIKENKTGY
jgi:hypothetical protein